MRVLILTHIFWPEGADFKNLALARALVARGHQVTVLTAFPNYPLGRLYDGYRLSWRQWENLDGVRVLRVPLYPDHSSSGFKRLLNYGSFTLAASTIGVLLSGGVDVVFVYSPPMTLGLTAGLFKLLRGAQILLDVVDLWPEAISGSGMVTSGAVFKMSGWIARCSYSVADRITVLTEGFAFNLKSVGVQRDKISVMPPWADRTQYPQMKPDPEFGAAYGLEGKFCIIHAGNIGPYQDIENILAAAARLQHLDDLRIVFVGGGRDLDRMRQAKKERCLHNVVFTGSYPPEAMAGIFAWAEALLVSLRRDPYLEINLPSKVPAYLASGRPVIACAAGETARLVEEHRLGFACPPGDPQLLAEIFARFRDCAPAVRAEMGRRAAVLFEKRFDKDLLINDYVVMLEEMERGTRSPGKRTRSV